VIEHLLFWTCCLSAVAGAVGAALVRNLFHAALLLGLSLVGVAGLYLFLECQWLACVQVVVYVGGILVLILFATLFSADVMGAVQHTPFWLRALGFLGTALAAAAGVRLAQVAFRSAQRLEHTRSATGSADQIGGDHAIGDLLTGAWSVPFLAAGALLTVALVGAVATVKRFRRPAGGAGG
jgi:NADH:ubiquinone oxidoreductase subunit 6 (subunit J)